MFAFRNVDGSNRHCGYFYDLGGHVLRSIVVSMEAIHLEVNIVEIIL